MEQVAVEMAVAAVALVDIVLITLIPQLVVHLSVLQVIQLQ